ncbi:hypothetical protein DPX16_22332 [Anabarilius grahami]|uniref:Zinc finger BED domain-containing protein 1 n=1 Tax=Anabarilius grahami TaxID=495550 RepID=A0A3N0YRI9_ANAGA|nr:hypothetical protein DPX16_22332 [Anabarilius grahami]
MTAKKCVAKTNHPTTSTQTSIEASLFSASPYPSTSQRHSEITNAVAFHLAKDMCSINTVTNEGFKFLVNTLDKRYVIPSRNYFSKVALPAMYRKRRGEIERDLANIKSSILKVNDDETDLTCTIKTKILSYLDEKYNDPLTQELLDMASALDPRFKLSYVSEDNVAPIHARLTSEMARTAPAAMAVSKCI